MAEQAMSRKERRERRQAAQRRKQIAAGAVLVGGLLLLAAAGWSLWGNRRTAQAAFDYGPDDVAYDNPIHAVHEMGAGPPIPFLPPGEPQPRVEVNERFHNLGSIGPTEVVTYEFVIANTGEGPLTVSRAYTTCGCTTADLTSSVIPPGKVAILTLRLDAGFHDVRGQTVRRGVILENNDPNHSSAEVWVQASVRSTP